MVSVSGLAGKLWSLGDTFVRFDGPEAFRAWDEGGFCKVAVRHEVLPHPDGSEIVSEVRIWCTDRGAQLRFRPYWAFIGPFSRFIGSELLSAATRRAERTSAASVLSAALRQVDGQRAGQLAQPGELALGVAAGALLHRGHVAGEQLGEPERLAGGGRRAGGIGAPHLGLRAGGDHRVDARVDPGVERGALHGERDEQRRVARVRGPELVPGGRRLPLVEQLERAGDALRVGGGDPRRDLRVRGPAGPRAAHAPPRRRSAARSARAPPDRAAGAGRGRRAPPAGRARCRRRRSGGGRRRRARRLRRARGGRSRRRSRAP